MGRRLTAPAVCNDTLVDCTDYSRGCQGRKHCTPVIIDRGSLARITTDHAGLGADRMDASPPASPCRSPIPRPQAPICPLATAPSPVHQRSSNSPGRPSAATPKNLDAAPRNTCLECCAPSAVRPAKQAVRGPGCPCVIGGGCPAKPQRYEQLEASTHHTKTR